MPVLWKLNPTGNPYTAPIRTVMWGYPATAAGVVMLPVVWSPLTKSIGQAGFPFGATIASGCTRSMVESMP